MAGNKNLHNANKAKKDEFYTQLCDIEKELSHYKDFFRNKVVFCNCDDPYESNFFKYFAMNFNFLGLKKLIATCYSTSPIAGSQISLLDVINMSEQLNENSNPYKIEINEVTDMNNDGAIDICDVENLIKNKNNVITLLKGNGDFRSDECIDLLKQADVVVTNPPFSLFREYVAQLIEYDKKFIIIGNQNSITYKEIFPLLKDNKMWLGYGFTGGATHFINKHYKDYATANSHKDGMIRVPGVVWYTNVDTKKRHENLILYRNYNEEEYPKYDNYDAINIDKTKDTPCDYYGEMGVPITFFDKYNPEQFEIVALGIVGSIDFLCQKKMEILKKGKPTGKYTVNAKGTLYKVYNPDVDKKPPAFRDVNTGELYSSIYARIIIKRRAKDEN